MEIAGSSISSLVLTFLILAVSLPLVSFVLCFAIGDRYSWIATIIAPLFLLISTTFAAIVFFQMWGTDPKQLTWHWFDIGGVALNGGLILDNLAVLMLLLVTVISFLVHFYSAGYMAGDTDIRRYFAMLGFFTFSMLGIVLAGNLLILFIFWELVGFSSYLLIGHWNEIPAAADAAKRSFLINRVGDAGFLIGLMIIWTNQSTFDIQLLTSGSTEPWQTAAGLCIFCGVAGKSAQFPLFTWLPAAMQGPTPVSALIHAATMVAAGVFLLARVFPFFTPATLDVVVVIGALTSLVAALSALVQYDLKKILAYSTISQLGLMVLAVGAGAPNAAILHLFTHAFFKACLFLSAGAVIHSLHQAQHQSHLTFDVQDIRNLGGLRGKLPFTFLVFVVSGSALAGIPFFTGFLSKDAILSALMEWKGQSMLHWPVVVSTFIVTFLTAVYTFRMIWNIFLGPENLTGALPVIEPPLVMRVPMAVLAIFSIWVFVSWNPFDHSGWLYNGLSFRREDHHQYIAFLSASWVAVAAGVAYLLRKRTLSSKLLYHAFYLDQMIGRIVERPAFRLSQVTARADKKWIDGVLHTAAYVQVMIAHFTGWIDRILVDGSVNTLVHLTKSIGSFTRSFQGGKIQLYVFWAMFATIIFIIWNLL